MALNKSVFFVRQESVNNLPDQQAFRTTELHKPTSPQICHRVGKE